ncbi:hypothetical protein NHJ6243_000784 [Beauveria neobassiana]
MPLAQPRGSDGPGSPSKVQATGKQGRGREHVPLLAMAQGSHVSR